ncbi:MAG: 50S ribosomal protein L25 [Patescibacteria group bacterium]
MTFALKAQVRDVFGKGVKNLRKQGILPAVLYGGGGENVVLSIDEQAFAKARRSAGESSLIELVVDHKGTENVLIHNVDYDPLTHLPRHVDFLRVRMDEKLRVAIPLRFEGEAPAIKQGGILVKVMHEVEVEALPAKLPHDLLIDLSRLNAFGDRIVLADVSLPAGVSFVGETDAVVALIEEPREEEPTGAVSEASQVEAVEVTGEKKQKEEESPSTGPLRSEASEETS